jgi:hypothetical protein
MGGMVRALYLMCEYLIRKSDTGLTDDHQDRSGARKRSDQRQQLCERLRAKARQNQAQARASRIA